MSAESIKARNRDLKIARTRALNQLADLHPAEYVILLDTVCADMGIDPPGSRPTGRPPRIGGTRDRCDMANNPHVEPHVGRILR